MSKNVINLMRRLGGELLAPEQQLFFEKIPIGKSEKFLKNTFILNFHNKDYFIFYPVLFDEIGQVNDPLQIELDTCIKNAILKENKVLENIFTIADTFENDRTLIILTQGDNNNLKNRRLVATVEENPYFFKKQVLLLNDKETEAINILLEAESIVEKCQEVISNSELFAQFKEELGKKKIKDSALYSLVAKLYEKLPFLTLDIKVQDTQNLTEEIDEALTNNKLLNLKDKLLTIDSDEGFEAYLEELLKKPKEEMNKHD